MLAEASVEPLDHAVGLGPERPGELVRDASFGAEAIHGMLPGGAVLQLVLLVDGIAVGLFAAVVREDRVNLDL
jgi:hypothetical protein